MYIAPTWGSARPPRSRRAQRSPSPISYHVILYYIVSYHIILYHITLYHIILYNIISYHTMLHYIILYYIYTYICTQPSVRQCLSSAAENSETSLLRLGTRSCSTTCCSTSSRWQCVSTKTNASPVTIRLHIYIYIYI